ncbi:MULTISPECIES: Arc family DNA-binding protein [Morganellaceae]|uniref:Arc family DNA-binding protein n=1 Tax=Morganellaceae TaxID=1903414 RepID=UPI000F4F9150|nr:Arc family DNA-binding protein [Proteus vulgaris]AYY81167.1 Arc family DNA-binding protein [Proteus vulgaris]
MKDTVKAQCEIEKLTLRVPKKVKEAVAFKAREEGLSLNSALVQRIVWSLNNEPSVRG